MRRTVQRQVRIIPHRGCGYGGRIDYREAGLNECEGVTLKTAGERRYQAVFNLWMSSRPGSDESRTLLARLQAMPTV